MGLEDPSSRTANTFIPRQVYSEYIKSTLQQMQAMSSANLEQLKDEALEANITDLEHFEVKDSCRRYVSWAIFKASNALIHCVQTTLCITELLDAIWLFTIKPDDNCSFVSGSWRIKSRCLTYKISCKNSAFIDWIIGKAKVSAQGWKMLWWKWSWKIGPYFARDQRMKTYLKEAHPRYLVGADTHL